MLCNLSYGISICQFSCVAQILKFSLEHNYRNSMDSYQYSIIKERILYQIINDFTEKLNMHSSKAKNKTKLNSF